MRRRKFTGCWTCRTRRLGCDEVKPECGQCRAKSICCEGYFAKLQWIPPVMNGSSQAYEAQPLKGSSRRMLLPAVQMKLLNEADIERALSEVERVATGRIGSRSLGPFSVFRLDAHLPSPAVSSRIAEHNDLSQQIEHSVELEADTEDSFAQICPDECYLEGGFGHRKLTRSEIKHQAKGSVQQAVSTEEQDCWPQESSISYQSDNRPSVQSHVSEFGAAGFLTHQVKHLIHNYVHNVIPIYCIIDTAHNPWRDFMLPRVLQCCTELEIGAPSTTSRQALLHAILTISAYNLQNVSSEDENQPSQLWSEVAAYHKGNALRLLESCLGESTMENESTDHDELLAAMLSMFTIDVISGDMQTSEIHLKGCEILILIQLRKHGEKLPDVTKSLHKIFIYLRVMQQASSLLFGRQREDLGCNSSIHTPLTLPGDSPDADELEAIFGSANDMEEINASSFEMIYGIAQSLVYLLRKTTRVMLVGCPLVPDHSPSQLSVSLNCDTVEAEVLEWPVEKKIAILKTAPTSTGNVLIVEHYSRAFHHALVIFWHCWIRKMHRRYAQPFIGKVISHLEQIEIVKQEFGIQSGHMLWPAFVAASQSLDSEVQSRFSKWFDTIAKEGIGLSRIAKGILIDIWNHHRELDSTEFQFVNLVLT